MDGGLRARGELCSGNDRDGRGLGEVEDGVWVLTVEAIGPRRLDVGDRQGGSVLGEEQRNDEIGARKKISVTSPVFSTV